MRNNHNKHLHVYVLYRTKQCRTKVTQFFAGDENFVKRKILSDEKFCLANNFVQNQIFEYCLNSQMSLNSSNTGLVDPFKWFLCKKIY